MVQKFLNYMTFFVDQGSHKNVCFASAEIIGLKVCKRQTDRQTHRQTDRQILMTPFTGYADFFSSSICCLPTRFAHRGMMRKMKKLCVNIKRVLISLYSDQQKKINMLFNFDQTGKDKYFSQNVDCIFLQVTKVS